MEGTVMKSWKIKHGFVSPRSRAGKFAGLCAIALSLAAPGIALAAPTEIVIPGDHVFPESLTSTAAGTVIIGSFTEGVVYRARPGAATAETWIKAGTNDLLSVLGVLADEKSKTLWVCSSDLSGLGITVPGKKETALKSFDLKTGAPKGSVALPDTGSLCNDIVIARDGSAFVTDSLHPRILRLKPGASQFDVWVENEVFGTKGPNLDGIAFGSDGQLYVNTYAGGKLFRVAVGKDGSAGAVTELTPSSPLDHPDGMRRLGRNTFLMIEGAGRLDLVTIKGDQAQIKVLKDGLNAPVSVTKIGSTAWALEGQLNLLFDPTKKGIKPQPFRAVAVPLN
jgi:sugar lactone lactonase YvrE